MEIVFVFLTVLVLVFPMAVCLSNLWDFVKPNYFRINRIANFIMDCLIGVIGCLGWIYLVVLLGRLGGLV